MNASMSPVMSKAVSGAAGSVIAMSEALSGSPEHHPGPNTGPNTAVPNTAGQPTTGVHSPVQPLPSSVEEMHKVSPKLMWPMLVSNALWTIGVCGGLYLAYREWGWGFLIPLGIFTVIFIWRFFLIPYQVRNMGWLETEDELVLSTGKMFHTITVIPYGRIQFVDVQSGPITRALGLKELTVHTASNSSNSDLPGLLAADADALRDRLALKARERMSGL